MNIGNMRHSIEIFQPSKVRNDYGAETITLNSVYKLRTEVKYNGGSKGINANEVFTSSSISFDIHFRTITEEMIIVFQSQKYKINSIIPVGFRSILTLICEKINE